LHFKWGRAQVRLVPPPHITGGGLSENIPRVLPPNTAAHINLASWQRPAVFDWLQEQGNISDSEITGYTKDEILGKNPSIFSSGKHPVEFYKEMWNELINSGHWHGELWNRRKYGEVYALRISIDGVFDGKGEL